MRNALLQINNYLAPEDCDSIIADAHTVGFKPSHVIEGDELYASNKSYRNSERAYLPLDTFLPGTLLRMVSRTHGINRNRLRVEPAMILKYGRGCYFKKHEDNSAPEVSGRIATCIIQLSEPEHYWGGNLKLWNPWTNKTEVASKRRGSMTVFPSGWTHQAQRIWKGTRYSMVVWVNDVREIGTS